MYPYAIVSDQHFHDWSQFSYTLPSGVNSRLQISINELERAGFELKKAGGRIIRNAGDTYHQRGNLKPKVINPVVDVHRRMTRQGIRFQIISGNHDLEDENSNDLGSAITKLQGPDCQIINDISYMGNVLMIPWIPRIEDLKKVIGHYNIGDRSKVDLIIHAPIDGVIPGLPDHGLTATWLAGQGFKRVFAGHYHNHKDFGNGVYSIGATTHQTWSDPGSKAGFLIVHEDRVEWFRSHAPEFVDLTDKIPEADVPLIVDGNYARCKVSTTKTSEIEKLRDWLTNECGAKGVVIHSLKEPTKARTGSVASSVQAGASIEASISAFIGSQSFNNAARVQLECQKILAETGGAI